MKTAEMKKRGISTDKYMHEGENSVLKNLLKQLFTSLPEKKVEYIELVYDLSFAYIISVNNERLQVLENGFFSFDTYAAFFLSTLIILQVWCNTTLLINRYGQNNWLDYIGIFINMYLIYYMIEGTNSEWARYYVQYNTAWGLILVNIGLQYFIKGKIVEDLTEIQHIHIRHQVLSMALQALLVFLTIPIYRMTGVALTWAAVFLGFAVMSVMKRWDDQVDVDFPHLSERMMLFVVFTFGVMIISIIGFFRGETSLNNIYTSLMTFLIMAGLLVSYGYFYEKVLERSDVDGSQWYILIHIVMIIALNSISVGLAYMYNPAVRPVPKTIFTAGAFVIYYVTLYVTGYIASRSHESEMPPFRHLALLIGIYALLMFLFLGQPMLTLALSVVFVFAVLVQIMKTWTAAGEEKAGE